MSQRAALLIAATLTALILVGSLALTARVMGATVANKPGDATSAPDLDPDREDATREAIDRLQEANVALADSYQRIATLLDDVATLQAQNAQLRERDAQYQQQLAEASQRLQQQGRAALDVLPPAPETRAQRDARSEQGSEHERD